MVDPGGKQGLHFYDSQNQQLADIQAGLELELRDANETIWEKCWMAKKTSGVKLRWQVNPQGASCSLNTLSHTCSG